MLEHRALMDANGWFDRRRREQALEWMQGRPALRARAGVRRDAASADRLAAMQQDVLHGRVSPFRAARELLTLFRRHPPAG